MFILQRFESSIIRYRSVCMFANKIAFKIQNCKQLEKYFDENFCRGFLFRDFYIRCWIRLLVFVSSFDSQYNAVLIYFITVCVFVCFSVCFLSDNFCILT